MLQNDFLDRTSWASFATTCASFSASRADRDLARPIPSDHTSSLILTRPNRLRLGTRRPPTEFIRMAAGAKSSQGVRMSSRQLLVEAQFGNSSIDGRPSLTAELGKRVREARERAGLTRSEASRRAGVDAAYWYRLENGLAAGPTFEVVARVAVALDVTLDWLAFGGRRPPRSDADDPKANLPCSGGTSF